MFQRVFRIVLLSLAGLLPLLGLYAQPAKTAAKALVVSTEPNTVVWIDDVRYGKTDEKGSLKINGIPAGKHRIRLRAPGFKQVEQPLTVVQSPLKVALTKTTDEAELAFQEAERLSTTDRAKTIEAYRRAIKLRPTYAEAQLALARVLSDDGDYEAAEQAVNAARKLRPGYAEASAVLGRIYKESGVEEDKVVATFKRAITEGRGFQPEAYTGLGLLYKEKAEEFGGQGDFQTEDANYRESANYLKTAAKQLGGAPDAIVIYQLLGLVYERQKRYAEAISVYEEFLRLFPDVIEASAVRSFIVQLKKEMH